MGPIEEGYRNEFSFRYCSAMAWLLPASDLPGLCQERAERVGLSLRDGEKIHSTSIKKAIETTESKEKTGVFKDTKYSHSAQKLQRKNKNDTITLHCTNEVYDGRYAFLAYS